MIGFFITARMGSTRLKDKHLLQICGKPALRLLIDRISKSSEFLKDYQNFVICVTTGTVEKNHLLEMITKNTSAEIYFGSQNNIPYRHLSAARDLGVDYIVSIDGDDLLIDVTRINLVISGLQKGYDYVTTKGLPLGMNISGYSIKALEQKEHDLQDISLETGWTQIFEVENTKFHQISGFEKYQNIRATLDYKEDFIFFKRCFEEIDNIQKISQQEL